MSITFATPAPQAPALNMANGNAYRVMDLLGLPVESVGECAGEEFLARVLLALALGEAAVDAAGRPNVVDGMWTDVGTAADYMAGRLIELHALAEAACRHREPVTWG